MAKATILEQRPRQIWQGLNLRVSDLLRNPDAASVARNIVYRRTGTISSREGTKLITGAVGGLGIATYTKLNSATGEEEVEILAIGESLHRMREGSLNLTYSGSAGVVTASMYAVGTSWRFIIKEDDVEAFSEDLGIGIEDASPYSITDLATDIAALADFGASVTGTGSVPAAFLPTFDGRIFSSGALGIEFNYLEEIYQPTGANDPFSSTWTNRNQPEFEFVSSCSGNNVLYLGSKYDHEQKYDGQKIYRSGIPAPAGPSASVVTESSGRTGTDIRYRISYVQIDKQGNRLEGIISDASGAVSPSTDHVDVTYTKLAPSSGFNTDCAIVDGTHGPTSTIAVDVGHTIKPGDTIYLYDTGSASFVTREVASTTTTSLVITGDVVSVIDNAPISANLRVALYTQEVTNGDYYLVAEFPHDSITVTTIITDEGQALGAKYFFPDAGTEPGLPPKCQHRAIYRNCKFLSGNLEQPDRVWRSDISSLEAYPTLANQFGILTNRHARITALFPTNEYLFIAKTSSCHQLIGDNDADTGAFRFRVDDLSLTVGCSSWGTVQQIPDGTILFANERGIYRVGAGTLPVEISREILPAFTPFYGNESFNYRRMQSFVDLIALRYVLFIPEESETSGVIHATQSSRTFCLDLSILLTDDPQAGRFSEWTSVNFGCGVVTQGRDVYFATRRFDSVASAVQSHIGKLLSTGTYLDKIDHTEGLPGIEIDYAPGWDDLGDPSSLKAPLRLKLFATDVEIQPNFVGEVDLETNFAEFPVCRNIFSFMGSLSSSVGYSYSPYSLAPYGAGSSPEREQKVGNVRCAAFRPRFRHFSRYETFVLSGWQWEISISYTPRIKE